MAKLGEAFVVIRAALGPLKAGLAAAKSAVTKAMSMITATIKKAMAITYKWIKRAMLAIAGAVTAAVWSFGSFEKAMRKATAVSDTTEAQFSKMAKMARAEAIRLNLAATETASAFYFLGSAGLSVKQQMEAFVPVMTLVKAGVGAVGETAENIVDIMKGFQISFSKTAHVTDVLAYAATEANATLPQFAMALKEVAGIGKMTNNTLEELTSAMAFMADVGFKGRRAGFMLRRILVRLMAPMSDVTKLMNKYNVSVYNTEGQMKPFVQLVGELSDALRGAGEEQRNMAFKTIFGQRAIAGQIAIFNKGKKELDKFTQALIDSGGTAQKIADKQLNSLTEQFGRLRKMIKDIFIRIGKYLSPALRWLIKDFQKGTEAIGEFVDKNEILITEWALMMAAKFQFVRKVVQDFIVGAYKNWPATWRWMSAVAINQFSAIWESFNVSIGSALEVATKLFIAFGKSLYFIFEKVFMDIGASIGTWLYNANEIRKARKFMMKGLLHKEGGGLAAITAAQKAIVMKEMFPGKKGLWVGGRTGITYKQKAEFDKRVQARVDVFVEKARKEAARIIDEKGPEHVGYKRREAYIAPWDSVIKKIGNELTPAFDFLNKKLKETRDKMAEIQDFYMKGALTGAPKWIKDLTGRRLRELHEREKEIADLIVKMRKEGAAAVGAATGGLGGTTAGGPAGGLAGAGGGRIGFMGFREAWGALAQSLTKDKTQENILKVNRGMYSELQEQTSLLDDLDMGMTT